MKHRIRTWCLAVQFCPLILLADLPTTIEVDTSQAPKLEAWCTKAQSEMTAWYPRIRNLLADEGFSPPNKIILKGKDSEKGVGGTAGATITIYSGWIQKHPDDLGMVIHELTHVIQHYPSPNPGWVTEGIADYLRWAIYEGKPLTWFPLSQEPSGYTRGYQVAAGFLLWLESGPAFGIVRKLNKAMREGKYSDHLFEESSGKSLPELWTLYQDARKRASPSPERSSRVNPSTSNTEAKP